MASHWFGDNKEVANGGTSIDDHPHDRPELQPFNVVHYIEQYDDRLDSRQISTISLAGKSARSVISTQYPQDN